MQRGAREAQAIEVDFLDLSLLTSDYGRHIHPCKGCVSTAMPLCHWPCSCYPNHSLNQVNDWMAEIYERWVAAHAVVIVTPTHWYQAAERAEADDRPAGLRRRRQSRSHLDPRQEGRRRRRRSSSQGWDYPKHLAGRVYGLVVHGDVAGIEGVAARALATGSTGWGWSTPAPQARLDRYIGYYEPYATSHDALDRDEAVQEETRNVARAVARVRAPCAAAS